MKKLGILLISMLVLTGCSAGQKSQDKTKTADSAQTSSSQTTRVAAPTSIKVSVTAAIKQFHRQFGQAVAISGLSLEREHGQYQYDVSGLDANREYEATVDARSGKLVHHEQEKLDQDEANGVAQKRDAIAVNRLKPLADISAAAVKRAGGGTAVEWSLEHENDQVQWEVKVRGKNQTHEVPVNAYTAKVVTVQQDDDDDDD